MNKKLGYYSVLGVTFDSKIKALIYATSLYKKIIGISNPKDLITWHFNDEVFGTYDWTIEPTNSLTSLYYKRARELREQYDYIVVSYSGGADSHNIVMSFLDQGLVIDELVVVMLEKNIKDYTLTTYNVDAKYQHSTETNLQLKPRLSEICLRSPNTKIIQLDPSDLIFKVFAEQKDASWILNMREELNPVDVTTYNYSLSTDFRKNLDKKNKIGILIGIDKPRILIDQDTNKIYTRISDRIANTIPIGEYIKDYSNTTIEFFYWDPSCLDLLCKQAHTIKHWLEANPDMQRFFYMKKLLNAHSNNIMRQLNDRLFRPLIYPNWNNTWFQADKPAKDWFTEADTWFIQGAKGTKEYNIWLEGIKFIIKNTFPYVNLVNKEPHSFNSWYKDYYLGLINRKD